MVSYDPDCECMECRYQTNKARQKEINKMHEKKKMTRKEAVETFSRHMPDVLNASRTIDFYIEAGMLEIVEEEFYVPAGFHFPAGKMVEWINCMKSIQEQGYKLTKA